MKWAFKTRSVAWLTIGSGLGWIVSGCGKAPEAVAPPPVVVTVASPVVREVTQYFEYTGNLAAMEQVDIVARVPGFLARQHYTPMGEDGRLRVVEPGQLLFEIEHEPYEIAVKTAEANVAQAQALEKAALTTRDKVRKAFDANAATEAELIESEAAYEQRVAERMAMEARLESAKLDLTYTFVKSPIQGVVSRNFQDVGALVGATGPTVLTRVTRRDPIYAYFDASEKIVLAYLEQRKAFEEGAKVEAIPVELARSNDPPGTYPFKGEVNFIDTSVDPGTGTITVRGEFANQSGALVPGLYVRLRVPFDTVPDAVLVREDALGTDLGGKFVYTVAKNEQGVDVVARTQVELGLRTDDGLRVVTGLDAGARYIVQGIQKVRPGVPVQAQPAAGVDPSPTPPNN